MKLHLFKSFVYLLSLSFFSLTGCISTGPSIDELFTSDHCEMYDDDINIVCDSPEGKTFLANPGWEDPMDEELLSDERLLLVEDDYMAKTRRFCNLRSKPTVRSKKVKTVQKNEILRVTKVSGKNWYEVKSGEKKAYISKICLSSKMSMLPEDPEKQKTVSSH